MLKKELKVGDKVRIVNVRDCLFGYSPTMIGLTGQTTVITNKEKCSEDEEEDVEYKVQIDGNKYCWSANCLELVEHIRFMKNE